MDTLLRQRERAAQANPGDAEASMAARRAKRRSGKLSFWMPDPDAKIIILDSVAHAPFETRAARWWGMEDAIITNLLPCQGPRRSCPLCPHPPPRPRGTGRRYRMRNKRRWKRRKR